MALLIDLLRDPGAAVADSLHDDVRFRSPFADYTGRPDVAHLVGLIRQALVDLRVSRQLAAGGDTMTRFEARIDTGEQVQGVLVEEHDDEGRLVEAMLTVRPYAGLRTVMRTMQRLLEASPLPGPPVP
jgi:hypothetical protein